MKSHDIHASFMSALAPGEIGSAHDRTAIDYTRRGDEDIAALVICIGVVKNATLPYSCIAGTPCRLGPLSLRLTGMSAVWATTDHDLALHVPSNKVPRLSSTRSPKRQGTSVLCASPNFASPPSIACLPHATSGLVIACSLVPRSLKGGRRK